MRWVDSSKQKPSNQRPVLVVYAGQVQWMTYRWCKDENRWEPTIDGYDNAEPDVFTHWMPLPYPPQDMKDETARDR